MSKGVSKDVRGVRGSKGAPGGGQEEFKGCPRGREKCRVSKGVKRDVRGVPGIQGTARDI